MATEPTTFRLLPGDKDRLEQIARTTNTSLSELINTAIDEFLAKRYKYNNLGLPVIYENDKLRVFKNPAGEIFVERINEENSKIRVFVTKHGLEVIAEQPSQFVLCMNKSSPALRIPNKS